MMYIEQILIPGKWYIVSDNRHSFLGELFFMKYMKLYDAPIGKLMELSVYPWEVPKEDTGYIYELNQDNFYLTKVEESPELHENSDIDIVKPTEIYVVLSRRWGCRDAHSYICGTAYTPETAKQLASQEEFLRGGKYKSEIFKTWIGSDIMIPLEP